MKSNLKVVDVDPTDPPVLGLDKDFPDEMMPLPLGPWPETGYKASAFARTGALLGGIGGCTSLLTNIVGSVLWPAISGQEQHPLRIIQIYLTFPFGESALHLHSGVLLALGCLLYVVTGIFYGILFEIVISYLLPHATFPARFMACTILALCIWAINFYVVLSWLQPLMLGGRWIIDLVPWWVAALTHLVFGWTIATLYSSRLYEPNARAHEAIRSL